MNKIFLAAPISAFKDESQYRMNRESLMALIGELQKENVVYSEIINIGTLGEYDTPAKSVQKDFSEISESSVFIMYHPKEMQTSTLIELGFAVALQKKIIVISGLDVLPYMALGLPEYNSDIQIIESGVLDKKVIQQVKNIVRSYE